MIILYHANCFDGLFAAYFTHLKLGGNAIPMHYQQALPNIDGQDVVCVDYCPTVEQLKTIKPNSLLVIDHHKTTLEELALFEADYHFESIFNLNYCGAMLTWMYFFPESIPPQLINYIQDRDLWQWKLDYSKEVSAYISMFSMTFKTCEELLATPIQFMIESGTPILRYQKTIIDKAVANARMTVFDGHKVPIVNSTVLQSEIGAELAKDNPFAIIWFNRDKDKKFHYSLRSDENGLDVGKICQAHGGGGHVHAAGFMCPWHHDQNEELENAQKQIQEMKEALNWYDNNVRFVPA